MKGKKEAKAKAPKDGNADGLEVAASIATKADLKSFLLNVRDKLAEQVAAPIYAVSALNHVLTLSNVYELLDAENRELARDIWLKIRQSGMHVRTPPMLFGPEEEQMLGGN